METASAERQWRPRANPWVVAMTVTLATFMEVLDTSIANVALPHIAGGLGASVDEATWVLTAFMVANAVILPAAAYMTTLIGRKKFYMICVTLFGLSSMLCGLAPSLPLLVFFRVLQGMGGGGLMPSEQAILVDTFPPEKRGHAFAMYGIAVVVAPAIGPTLGGWITDNYDWRWIFFINVPVCLLSLFLTSRVIEDPPWVKTQVAESRRGGFRLDYIGFALLGLTFGSLQFVLDKGQEDDWFGSRAITTFFVIMVTAFLLLIYWELRQARGRDRPIVNLGLFTNRNFAISFVLMYVLGFTLYGTTILIPQFAQALLGYTAELAGLVLSPSGFATMAMMPLVGYLSSRVDLRKLIGYGFLMLTVSLFLMLTMNLDITYGRLVYLRVIGTSGLGFLFIPINMIAFIGIPREENNSVSGLTNLATNVGGSCGTAFVSTMLVRRSAAHETHMIRNMTTGNPAFVNWVEQLKGAFGAIHSGVNPLVGQAAHTAQAYIYLLLQRQAAMLAYLDVIRILMIICACMLPLLLLIPRPPKNLTPNAGH